MPKQEECMLKPIVCFTVLMLLAGCSSAKSNVKPGQAAKKAAPERTYRSASQEFQRCKETSLKKNLPASDDADSIRAAVVADCQKEFSDYWMATMLKYRIQTDLNNFQQAFLENLDQEIAQKLAQKDTTTPSKP